VPAVTAPESTSKVIVEIMAHIKNGITEEHRLARQSAVDAVKHAVACGELLIKLKSNLKHGEFGKWISDNCEFSQATANNYMKAAKSPNALGTSIRHLFPSGRPSDTRKRDLDEVGDHDEGDGHRGEDHDGAVRRTVPPQPKWRTGRQKILAIERAVNILKPLLDRQQILNGYQDSRSKVTREKQIVAGRGRPLGC
jgi:hypothetical protein